LIGVYFVTNQQLVQYMIKPQTISQMKSNSAWICSHITPPPTAETCDGRDDDGDGQIDEGVTATCSYGSPSPYYLFQTCAPQCYVNPPSVSGDFSLASSCGNKLCQPDFNESCKNCPSDCTGCPTECGDGYCQPPESCSNCPQDCGKCPICGNGICEPGETCQTCPLDGCCNAQWTGTVSFQITSTWEGGYCASLTITNVSGPNSNAWSAKLTVANGTMQTPWSCTVVSSTTTSAQISNSAWNGQVSAQGSNSDVGFCGTTSSSPVFAGSVVFYS